jgi:hypothetical protein
MGCAARGRTICRREAQKGRQNAGDATKAALDASAVSEFRQQGNGQEPSARMLKSVRDHFKK